MPKILVLILCWVRVRVGVGLERQSRGDKGSQRQSEAKPRQRVQMRHSKNQNFSLLPSHEWFTFITGLKSSFQGRVSTKSRCFWTQCHLFTEQMRKLWHYSNIYPWFLIFDITLFRTTNLRIFVRGYLAFTFFSLILYHWFFYLYFFKVFVFFQGEGLCQESFGHLYLWGAKFETEGNMVFKFMYTVLAQHLPQDLTTTPSLWLAPQSTTHCIHSLPCTPITTTTTLSTPPTFNNNPITTLHSLMSLKHDTNPNLQP